MIDLRDRELPNQIMVGGSFFRIKTDFRIWIEFGDMVRSEKTLMQMDIANIFEDDSPSADYIKEIFDSNKVKYYVLRNEASIELTSRLSPGLRIRNKT